MLKFNQNMQYFFILGTNPTLSLAELTSVFPLGRFFLIQKNIALLEIDYEIKTDIIKKIGGVIKFGLIHGQIASCKIQDILKIIAFLKPEKIETKFQFGISLYGKAKINIKALAMEFKKLLKQAGLNSRWVISREPTLSSVVVEQNKLTSDRGVEIVIMEFNKKLFLGKTLAVQPFKELSFRDYGRPARDDRSGMLPPKLAQIMINLSGANNDSIILDPFCGSGTIITEATLMGYKNLIGSDVSDRALQATKTNIAWIQSNFQLSTLNFKLFNSDATQISKQIQPNSVDAIVTEPYLGPQQSGFEITRVVKELEQLYSKSLMEFKKILKPNGRIVMVWPVFQGKRQPDFINPNITGYKFINPITENLQKNIFIKLTARHTIVYGREGQKIWREIVILKK